MAAQCAVCQFRIGSRAMHQNNKDCNEAKYLAEKYSDSIYHGHGEDNDGQSIDTLPLGQTKIYMMHSAGFEPAPIKNTT